jgi:hypothetical protein
MQGAQDQPRCGFTPQGDFRSIHAIYTRLAARCASGRYNHVSGKEPEFHQAAGDIFGKIDPIKSSGLALPKLGQILGACRAISRSAGVLIDSQLQHGAIIRRLLKHIEYPDIELARRRFASHLV